MTRDVSVVIPFYNREAYIDEALRSVFSQTLRPLEVIVVNDCSRESSRRHLEKYAPTCTIIDLPRNVGVAAARNEGIRRARGQFIAFLDDDDLWLPEKLERQRKYFEAVPECDAVCSSFRLSTCGRLGRVWTCVEQEPLTLAQALTHNHFIFVQAMMVRRSVLISLKGFDVGFRGSEDHELLIRCCAAGHRIQGIPDVLVYIRRDGHASLSQKQWQIWYTHLKLCWKHRHLYRRAYGARGLPNFLLASLQMASSKTRYVDGAVRRLTRILQVKWRVRAGYIDPVVEGAKLETPVICREVLK